MALTCSNGRESCPSAEGGAKEAPSKARAIHCPGAPLERSKVVWPGVLGAAKKFRSRVRP